MTLCRARSGPGDVCAETVGGHGLPSSGDHLDPVLGVDLFDSILFGVGVLLGGDGRAGKAANPRSGDDLMNLSMLICSLADSGGCALSCLSLCFLSPGDDSCGRFDEALNGDCWRVP